MPLNLSTGAQFITNQGFQARVAVAFYFVARQVFEEPPDTPGHEQRVAFARSIVLQDYEQFMQYAALVATDPAIVDGGPYQNPAAAPSDAVIIAAVSAMWDRLAGVPAS